MNSKFLKAGTQIAAAPRFADALRAFAETADRSGAHIRVRRSALGSRNAGTRIYAEDGADSGGYSKGNSKRKLQKQQNG